MHSYKIALGVCDQVSIRNASPCRLLLQCQTRDFTCKQADSTKMCTLGWSYIIINLITINTMTEMFTLQGTTLQCT